MPELPEVETIVRGLQQTVIGKRIADVWNQYPQTIRTHDLEALKTELTGRSITSARRRAKYILIDLSGGKTLAIHQKMSGHLLHGKWQHTNDSEDKQLWTPLLQDLAYHDPYNRFIRFVLSLDDGSMLGLSDVRRFARVYLTDTDKLNQLHDLGKLGPEPLSPELTTEGFYARFSKRKGLIKKLLMDPYVIAGIGNIYADEILWHSEIHPQSRAEHLTRKHYGILYENTREILTRAIAAKGHSEMNYRTLNGEKGGYQDIACVYQLDGTSCKKQDGGIIQKIQLNNRSAHFCPIHQTLYE